MGGKDCGCSFTNDEEKKNFNYDFSFYNYCRLSAVIIELHVLRQVVSEQPKKLKSRINCNKSDASCVHINSYR